MDRVDIPFGYDEPFCTLFGIYTAGTMITHVSGEHSLSVLYHGILTQRMDQGKLQVIKAPTYIQSQPNLSHRDIAWPTPLPVDRRGGHN